MLTVIWKICCQSLWLTQLPQLCWSLVCVLVYLQFFLSNARILSKFSSIFQNRWAAPRYEAVTALLTGKKYPAVDWIWLISTRSGRLINKRILEKELESTINQKCWRISPFWFQPLQKDQTSSSSLLLRSQERKKVAEKRKKLNQNLKAKIRSLLVTRRSKNDSFSRETGFLRPSMTKKGLYSALRIFLDMNYYWSIYRQLLI